MVNQHNTTLSDNARRPKEENADRGHAACCVPRLIHALALCVLFFSIGIGISVVLFTPRFRHKLINVNWQEVVSWFDRRSAYAEEGREGWCGEHHVPEEMCIACSPHLWPRKRVFWEWCEKHRVPECPLCHPEIAELSSPPEIRDSDFQRASEPSEGPINPECTLHQRLIQLASADIMELLDIHVAPVQRGVLRETVEGEGRVELHFRSTFTISAPFSGVIKELSKQTGDSVHAGDVLLSLESPQLAQWSSQQSQSAQLASAKRVQLYRLLPLQGLTLAPLAVEEVTAEWELATVRQWAAGEKLAWVYRSTHQMISANTLPDAGVHTASLAESPQDASTECSPGGALSAETLSLAVRSPGDGRVHACFVGPGERIVRGQPLMKIGDPDELLLTVWLRPEDAQRIRPGQLVLFQHSGHSTPDKGHIIAVSPFIDENSRLVAVWASLEPSEKENHLGTPGRAEIVVAENRDAILVPESAVHWEGDCFVVFVKDRDFERSPYKVFHVRKLRIGRKVDLDGQEMREILAGLVPGELVATTNSFVLRGALLEDRLGAGCTEHQ